MRFTTGQDIFFPDKKANYRLKLLPDDDDSPKYAQEALYRFMVTVAYLNTAINKAEQNYSILVHTSGKQDDHKLDKKAVESVFQSLLEPSSTEYKRTMERLAKTAEELFPSADLQQRWNISLRMRRETLL
jgi:hypothetical protein